MARAVRPGVSENESAPKLAKTLALESVGDRCVTGEAVGQNTKVGSPARIRVVAQSHETCFTAQPGGEGNQIANRGALNIGTEDGHDIGFRFERRPRLNQRFRGFRIELPSLCRQPAKRVTLGACRAIPRPASPAGEDLARLAVEHIELQIMVTGRRCESARRPGDSGS